MPAPKKAHDEMISRSKSRIESIFKVIEARKEVALTSNLSRNLSMGEERVDLLLRISYNEIIYDLPIEIETQEGNTFQIEKNIGKCVEAFGGMLVVPKSSMIPSIKQLLKEIPVKYSKRTMVLSYALMQTKTKTSDRIIKEAIEQLLPALSST
jgi:hypothetical protein